jgi:formylmethanofuran dehydrogenase subunit B
MTAGTAGRGVCLGCGCACDDIAVAVSGGRIAGAENACALGLAWYGDGTVPARVTLQGAPAARDAAIGRVADLMAAGPAMVYLAPDITTEAQREAIALADRAGARLDSVTSDTAAAGILVAQRRGRAAATLGELRNRADLLVFWAVDPGTRYPRYLSRYALNPSGTHVPAAGRAVIAVDVGAGRGPAETDTRIALAPEDEAAALGLMRAMVMGREVPGLPAPLAAAVELARRMTRARYVGIVHDGEPSPEAADPQRGEGLVALAQALNGPTRCALSTLRAGGNRSGADAAMTWQTGFPFAVDFGPGFPRYRPEEPASAALRDVTAVLIVGAAQGLPRAVVGAMAGRRVALIGPRASEAPFPVEVAIDTGIAGIHEAGMAYRMDDVPLPVFQIVPGPPATVAVLRSVAAALKPSGQKVTR